MEEIEKPVFYLVSKVGCVPCRNIKMILSALSVAKSVDFVYIDAKDDAEFIEKNHIIGVPTLVRKNDNAKFIGLPKEEKYADLVKFLEGK